MYKKRVLFSMLILAILACFLTGCGTRSSKKEPPIPIVIIDNISIEVSTTKVSELLSKGFEVGFYKDGELKTINYEAKAFKPHTMYPAILVKNNKYYADIQISNYSTKEEVTATDCIVDEITVDLKNPGYTNEKLILNGIDTKDVNVSNIETKFTDLDKVPVEPIVYQGEYKNKGKDIVTQIQLSADGKSIERYSVIMNHSMKAK